MKVDYHIHTLCSDGSYTVKEVFEKITKNHISSFSITDHDTIAGIKPAKQLSNGIVEFVNGVEITCAQLYVSELQKTISIHLLGYLFDENNITLQPLLEKRNVANGKIFETLAEDFSDMGYPFSISDVPISCGSVLQLCDIANYLKNSYPAISSNRLDYVQSYAPKLSRANITVQEGISAIHAAGGKAVWAHPFIVYHDFQKQKLTFDEVTLALAFFQQLGLDGIEADYWDFQEKERAQLRELSSCHSLFYTCGSDFHGSRHRNHLGIESSSDWLNTFRKEIKIWN